MSATASNFEVAPPGRVVGIDSIRFWLAAWVVLYHFPITSILPALTHTPTSRALTSALFNGQAAVMAFFVISGFCIHLPYSSGRRLELLPYFVRREVRIIFPILAVLALAATTGNYAFMTVIWSLVCEETYYAAYPVVLLLQRRWGWAPILVAATLCSLGTIPVVRHTGFVQGGGYVATAVILYLLWLLGCMLADSLPNLAPASGRAAWIWLPRVGILSLSATGAALFYHSRIDYIYTMPAFGVLTFFWLRSEIRHYKRVRPQPVFEVLGRASYSLYFIHPQALVIAGIMISGAHPATRWFATIGIVAALSLTLYVFVEAPSHRFARWLGRRVSSASGRVAAPEALAEPAAQPA